MYVNKDKILYHKTYKIVSKKILKKMSVKYALKILFFPLMVWNVWKKFQIVKNTILIVVKTLPNVLFVKKVIIYKTKIV